MSFKKALKPNIVKILVSIGGALLWLARLKRVYSSSPCPEIVRKPGFFENCAHHYPKFALFDDCMLRCVGPKDLVLQYLVGIVLPFVVVYLIYSVGEFLVAKIRG